MYRCYYKMFSEMGKGREFSIRNEFREGLGWSNGSKPGFSPLHALTVLCIKRPVKRYNGIDYRRLLFSSGLQPQLLGVHAKVITKFWDIPLESSHLHMTYNVVLADSKGYIVLAMVRRPADMIRKFCSVLVPGYTFGFRRFTIKVGPNIINPDLKIIMEPFTGLELLANVIKTPPILFQPLNVLAATTYHEPCLIIMIPFLPAL
ncbi:hypothetical protein K1719_028698 [Acacia pycnantha]|nr:hypothetical protein K1719_028698 [Acacia pycnantha]